MYKQYRRVPARARALAGACGVALTGGLLVAGTWTGAVPAVAETNPPVPARTPPAPAPTPPVDAATTASPPARTGYWLASTSGDVNAFSTTNFGTMAGRPLDQPVAGAASTSDGHGYWLVAADGGIFTFGNAAFHGSTGGRRLNEPIVGMAADPATGGYWLVAADGGVFSFDAPYFGSMGGKALSAPVVGIQPTPDGHGYWLVARDGGIFSFGGAGFYGSMGGKALSAPVVGMARTASGAGYWLVGADGGVFTFGDAPFLGSAAGTGFGPVVAMAATSNALPLGSAGTDVSQHSCGHLPAALAFNVVEITAGYVGAGPNACYQAEAAWAGRSMGAYIMLNGLANPPPAESLIGPKGACAPGDVICESYNFGWYWARYWFRVSSAAGARPAQWWLDVEVGQWSLGSGYTASNDAVISGAVDGLRKAGVQPGIYSTSLQWPKIAGSLAFPGIPLWVAGAGSLNGGGVYPSAASFCTDPRRVFAGGKVSIVQYGYTPQEASDFFDPDYACP